MRFHNARAGLWGVLVAVMVLLVPSVASAAGNEEFMIAKVPFDFVVGPTTLPAGTYKVEVEPNGNDRPGVLAIQTASESKDELHFRKVYISTTPADTVTEGKPRLVFKRVGEINFLEKVVPPAGEVKEVH